MILLWYHIRLYHITEILFESFKHLILSLTTCLVTSHSATVKAAITVYVNTISWRATGAVVRALVCYQCDPSPSSSSLFKHGIP